MLSLEQLIVTPAVLQRDSSSDSDTLLTDCHSFQDFVTAPTSPTSPTERLLLPPQMRCEQSRVRTLRARTDGDSARQLARYGFYFSSQHHCLRCAFCGLEVSGLSSVPQDVKLWHWQVSGTSCPLLLSGAERNARRPCVEEGSEVKRLQTLSGGMKRDLSTVHTQQQQQQRLSHHRHHHYHHHHRGLLQHQPQDYNPEEPSPIQFLKLTKNAARSDVPENQTLVAPGPTENGRDGSSRSSPSSTSRGTFTSQKPRPQSSTSSPSPSSAARLRTKCVEGSRSNKGDCEQAGSTPKCNFTPDSHSPSNRSPSDTNRSDVQSSGAAGVPVWADIVRTARMPSMVPYQARLHTFLHWPLLSPTPRDLARAGFYSDAGKTPTISTKTTPHKSSSHQSSSAAKRPASGAPTLLLSRPEVRGQDFGSPSRESNSGAAMLPGDRSSAGESVSLDSVRCFWCGERVHCWQKSDDPVLEHARLSPSCRYVIQLLGRQLHRDVIMASESGSGC